MMYNPHYNTRSRTLLSITKKTVSTQTTLSVKQMEELAINKRKYSCDKNPMENSNKRIKYDENIEEDYFDYNESETDVEEDEEDEDEEDEEEDPEEEELSEDEINEMSSKELRELCETAEGLEGIDHTQKIKTLRKEIIACLFAEEEEDTDWENTDWEE